MTMAHGTVQPTFRVGFPTSGKLLWKQSLKHVQKFVFKVTLNLIGVERLDSTHLSLIKLTNLGPKASYSTHNTRGTFHIQKSPAS